MSKRSRDEVFEGGLPFYCRSGLTTAIPDEMPRNGHPAQHVLREIEDYHKLDFSEYLNTSSYVNVVAEPEECAITLMGMRVNLADQTVYPQSFRMHNWCVNIIAKLWHCPAPTSLRDGLVESPKFSQDAVYSGAGTVGSTEVCLLAGLALKFRWRAWYSKKHGLNPEQALGVKPNIVISNLFQAAWEKLFRYMDVDYRLVNQSINEFKLDVSNLEQHIDDKTIGVVCIMGNHYGGQYDPVQEVDQLLTKINLEKEYQVGIHVDAASGGFVAPFQDDADPWDFRLSNVLSISASGHKFGESCIGTGWVVWRQRRDLAEHVAVSVSYLGGDSDSYTLNFSRPASGVYNQYYKLMRLGTQGYRIKTESMMEVAEFIRTSLKGILVKDKPIFQILDDGSSRKSLPVVAARIDPMADRPYDDIDLQCAISQFHWFVSGYHLKFEDPFSKKVVPLFSDEPEAATMFRVVVKSNLTMSLAKNLVRAFEDSIQFLEEHGKGYLQVHRSSKTHRGHKLLKKC